MNSRLLLRSMILLLFLYLTGCRSAGEYAPEIDPTNFVTKIDNPYFTLIPGTTFIFDDGIEERVEVAVTTDTKQILGVTCIVVRDTVYEDGELVEDTFDWFAQDKQGNVWYFGEESKEFKAGKMVSTAGSWQAGVDGALPGIIMEAAPQEGDSYRQEYYKGEAEDMAEVVSLNASVSIPYGDFVNCIQIKEWTPLERGAAEYKYHCPAVGYVVLEEMIGGGSNQLKLISIETP